MNKNTVSMLLFEMWDPLGLKNFVPSDEYDHYAINICNMIDEGRSFEELQMYLRSSRLLDLMAAENDDVDAAVISEILNIKDGIQPGSEEPS